MGQPQIALGDGDGERLGAVEIAMQNSQLAPGLDKGPEVRRLLYGWNARQPVRQNQGLAPRRNPIRPMRTHLHVCHLHRRNRLLLAVINES